MESTSLPLVSIIIPTFNRKNLLIRCLESILTQSYANIEIIISDNASTDGTADAVNNFISKNSLRFPVKYTRNSVNLGMVGNWNHALFNHSTGKYALLLSDDDILLDEVFIEEIVSSLEGADAKIGFCRCKILDSSTLAEIEYLSSGQKVEIPREGNLQDILSRWGKGGVGPGLGFALMLQTVVFDRSYVVDRVGGFNQDIISIDYKTWFSVLGETDRYVFWEGYGAAYCVHSQNEVGRNPPPLEKWIENFDCYLVLRSTSWARRNSEYLDFYLTRILYDCLHSWPGNFAKLGNLMGVYKLLSQKDPLLGKLYVKKICTPIAISKIFVALLPSHIRKRVYSTVRTLRGFN